MESHTHIHAHPSQLGTSVAQVAVVCSTLSFLWPQQHNGFIHLGPDVKRLFTPRYIVLDKPIRNKLLKYISL